MDNNTQLLSILTAKKIAGKIVSDTDPIQDFWEQTRVDEYDANFAWKWFIGCLIRSANELLDHNVFVHHVIHATNEDGQSYWVHEMAKLII